MRASHNGSVCSLHYALPTRFPLLAALGAATPTPTAVATPKPLPGAYVSDADVDGPADLRAFVKHLGDAAHRCGGVRAACSMRLCAPLPLPCSWAAHVHVCAKWDDRRFSPLIPSVDGSDHLAAKPRASAGLLEDATASAAAKLDPAPAAASSEPLPPPFQPVPYRRHFSSTAVACAVVDLWPLLVRLFTVVLRLQPPRLSPAVAAPATSATSSPPPAPAPQHAIATQTSTGSGSSRGSMTTRGMMAMFGLGAASPSQQQPTSAAAASRSAASREAAEAEQLVGAALEPASPAETETRLSVLDTLKHALTAALFLGLAPQVQEGADALLQVRPRMGGRRRAGGGAPRGEACGEIGIPCPLPSAHRRSRSPSLGWMRPGRASSPGAGSPSYLASRRRAAAAPAAGAGASGDLPRERSPALSRQFTWP